LRIAHLVLCLALLAGCHREAVAPTKALASLEGLTLPLRPHLEVRLEVEGKLGAKAVPVVLDVARPLTRISTACFEGTRPAREGTWKGRGPSGEERTWPLTRLEGLSLGGVELPAWRVGLSSEDSCQVALGMDVLAPYALTVEPTRREVTFSPSRPREEYQRQEEEEDTGELELSLALAWDESSGWWLLPGRVEQRGVALNGVFALDTLEPHSLVSREPAEAAGLVPLKGQRSRSAAFLVDKLLLVDEEWRVSPLFFEAGTAWGMPHVAGRLSMDVWGRFRTTVDAKAGVVVLRQRMVEGSGERSRCHRPAEARPSAQACYSVHLRRLPEGGMLVTGAVHRDLPEGGRLLLEPVDAQGQPLPGACGVGFTFIPSSRGVTLQQAVPWPELDRDMPRCAALLREARGYALSFFEEGLSHGCPTTCAFVHEPSNGQTLCQCQRTSFGDYVITTPERRQAVPGSRPTR
jgi:hypothetical protein